MAAFSRYCKTACNLWDSEFPGGLGTVSPLFDGLLRRIERGGAEVIQTSWGGVVIERHDPPNVEKYLVIRRAGCLALEMHEAKVEDLEVKEGTGLILSQDRLGNELAVSALKPGDRFHFEPGQVHSLIGTEDLLVFERSDDPRGMDQDLRFVYEADGHQS